MTPFEFNFFFTIVAFTVTAFYSFVITSNYTQILEHLDDPQFVTIFVIFSLVGAVFSFSIACTVAIAGPLSLNITGIIKDVFLTYAGFIFFDDANCTPCVMVGLAVSFGGAIKTIVGKMQESNKTSKDIDDTKQETADKE